MTESRSRFCTLILPAVGVERLRLVIEACNVVRSQKGVSVVKSF